MTKSRPQYGALGVGTIGLAILSMVAFVTTLDTGSPFSHVSTPTAGPAVEKRGGVPNSPPKRAVGTERIAPAMVINTPQRMRAAIRYCQNAPSAAIPELRRLALSARDPLLAGNAVRALGRLGVVANDQHLVALIRDPRLRMRQEAVVALGVDGDPTAVEPLASILAGTDATIRPLAIEALGKAGGETARKLLEAVLQDRRAPEIDRVFARAALVYGRRRRE